MNIPPESLSVECGDHKHGVSYTFCRKITQVIEFSVNNRKYSQSDRVNQGFDNIVSLRPRLIRHPTMARAICPPCTLFIVDLPHCSNNVLYSSARWQPSDSWLRLGWLLVQEQVLPEVGLRRTIGGVRLWERQLQWSWVDQCKVRNRSPVPAGYPGRAEQALLILIREATTIILFSDPTKCN